MRIFVTHDTTYRYAAPARGVTQVLRLTPRSDEGQHVTRWRIDLDSDGRLRAGEDSFGNVVHTLAVEGPVETITVKVSGQVDTQETSGVVGGTVERVPLGVYLRETPLTTADEAIRAFTRDAIGTVADELTAAHALLAAIHQRILFDTAPTTVATTAAEAFALKRGVCQDLSHIFITAARLHGLPARYVSGYFRRGDGVDLQEAGHAWAEVRIPGLGWVGFDPTNGICAGEAHVRVAVALDYLGAAPVRGSRYGGGGERLDVSIHVADTRMRRSSAFAASQQSQG